MNEGQSTGKRYRNIVIKLPEHIACQIENRIGGNTINSIGKLFYLQFAQGKAGVNVQFEPTPQDLEKL